MLKVPLQLSYSLADRETFNRTGVWNLGCRRLPAKKLSVGAFSNGWGIPKNRSMLEATIAWMKRTPLQWDFRCACHARHVAAMISRARAMTEITKKFTRKKSSDHKGHFCQRSVWRIPMSSTTTVVMDDRRNAAWKTHPAKGGSHCSLPMGWMRLAPGKPSTSKPMVSVLQQEAVATCPRPTFNSPCSSYLSMKTTSLGPKCSKITSTLSPIARFLPYLRTASSKLFSNCLEFSTAQAPWPKRRGIAALGIRGASSRSRNLHGILQLELSQMICLTCFTIFISMWLKLKTNLYNSPSQAFKPPVLNQKCSQIYSMKYKHSSLHEVCVCQCMSHEYIAWNKLLKITNPNLVSQCLLIFWFNPFFICWRINCLSPKPSKRRKDHRKSYSASLTSVSKRNK